MSYNLLQVVKTDAFISTKVVKTRRTSSFWYPIPNSILIFFKTKIYLQRSDAQQTYIYVAHYQVLILR